MSYFYTSDFHLNHKNIIKYCERPFSSIEEMNKEIIKRYNEKIKKEDTVFHIGDFSFGSEDFSNKFNGTIIKLKGNHDKKQSTIMNINLSYNGQNIFLTHRPKHYSQNHKFNLVGHIHNKWKFRTIYGIYLINVGVDVWNFTPVSFDEIMKELKTWNRTRFINTIKEEELE